MPPREQIGVVSKLVKSKGFGFITEEGGWGQLFFHAAAVRDGAFDDPDFHEGTRVSFIVAETPKGRRALHVRAIPEGEGEDG